MLGTVMVLAGRHGEGYPLLGAGMRTLRDVGAPADWHVAVTSLASTLLVLERGDLAAAQHNADAGMAIFRRHVLAAAGRAHHRASNAMPTSHAIQCDSAGRTSDL